MNNLVATRTNLNQIIKWSSSRYNSLKKREVVSQILFYIERGTDIVEIYETGTYTEKTGGQGWDYKLTISNGQALLQEIGNNNQSYLLNPSLKRNVYSGAKSIILKQPVYAWHNQIIGIELHVVDEEHDRYFICLDDHPYSLQKEYG
ncbi:hypothetical protein ASD24_24330 [Paenibacillus sp. Root52]|uniref:hypothetical protein n=1 Tax=Paenibacillus sp. Root52 TaxID=1736552 RepID=UPI0006FC73CB|nr:hypothetical protein [Paenibacillus sp. Root52]KQY90929.1 hypothetical protein ASD24_24330 [Paenibacillus sp. Root52]